MAPSMPIMCLILGMELMGWMNSDKVPNLCNEYSLDVSAKNGNNEDIN